MPISLSAKKSHRRTLSRTIQNRSRKRRIHLLLKTVNDRTVPETVSIIDKAVKWGLWHKNKAARVKSRLAKQFSPTHQDSSRAKVSSTPTASKTKKVTAKKSPTKKLIKAKPRSVKPAKK